MNFGGDEFIDAITWYFLLEYLDCSLWFQSIVERMLACQVAELEIAVQREFLEEFVKKSPQIGKMEI